VAVVVHIPAVQAALVAVAQEALLVQLLVLPVQPILAAVVVVAVPQCQLLRVVRVS
jgi:hypothetical protein